MGLKPDDVLAVLDIVVGVLAALALLVSYGTVRQSIKEMMRNESDNRIDKDA